MQLDSRPIILFWSFLILLSENGVLDRPAKSSAKSNRVQYGANRKVFIKSIFAKVVINFLKSGAIF